MMKLSFFQGVRYYGIFSAIVCTIFLSILHLSGVANDPSPNLLDSFLFLNGLILCAATLWVGFLFAFHLSNGAPPKWSLMLVLVLACAAPMGNISAVVNWIGSYFFHMHLRTDAVVGGFLFCAWFFSSIFCFLRRKKQKNIFFIFIFSTITCLLLLFFHFHFVELILTSTESSACSNIKSIAHQRKDVSPLACESGLFTCLLQKRGGTTVLLSGDERHIKLLENVGPTDKNLEQVGYNSFIVDDPNLGAASICRIKHPTKDASIVQINSIGFKDKWFSVGISMLRFTTLALFFWFFLLTYHLGGQRRMKMKEEK